MQTAKGLIQKALNKSKGPDNSPSQSTSEKREQLPIVSLKDVYKYRFQYGVNLGSIFVLEKWLFPGMFDEAAQGGSELDAITASIHVRGLQATIVKWEAHWSNALTKEDIDFLVNEAHCNTIRLPIGYFTLGPNYCKGTLFDGEPGQVYVNAWRHVLAICDTLAQAGIGVLIDMHALPGGANKDSHSGTLSQAAGLWGSKQNIALAKHCLVFIAREISALKIPNCVGLQLCNEAAWAAKGMYDWYADVTAEISRIDSTIPLYISDAWDLKTALEWTRKKNTLTSNANLVIIDTHKYYTFDEKHKSKSPQQIIRIVPEALSACALNSSNILKHGAAPVFIGEYSCVMDTRSWACVAEGEKDFLTQQFGQAQCQQWHSQSCGSAFWTLKMSWMPGGGWGFVAQTRKGNIQAPSYLTLPWDEVGKRINNAEKQRDNVYQHEVQAHSDYWDMKQPGKKGNHWRFEAGWKDGWNDALTFFGMRRKQSTGSAGADRIGCLDGWIRKRMMEAGQTETSSWEYEHGFRNAVDKAEGFLLGASRC